MSLSQSLLARVVSITIFTMFSAHAQSETTRRPLLVARPPDGTCVDVQDLIVAISHSGEFLASTAPESVLRLRANFPLVTLSGNPAALTVTVRTAPPQEFPQPLSGTGESGTGESGTGESGTGESGAPSVITGALTPQTCDTAAQAAAAFVVSSLSPAGAPRSSNTDQPPQPVPASVPAPLPPAPPQASCAACSVRAPQAASWGLPSGTGAVLATAGATYAAVTFLGSEGSTNVALFGAAPLVLGGAGSYVVPREYASATVLSGYWVGLAGAMLSSASISSDFGDGYAGGAVTAGAVTSAALVWIDAATSSEISVAPWTVALPSALGGLLAVPGFFESFDSIEPDTSLAIGVAASALPLIWLAWFGDLDGAQPVPDVALHVNPDGALLVHRGEF